MRSDRLIRPGQRKPKASAKPSAASASYPLSDFIVPPSDAKGRSVATSIALPPAMRRVSSVVLQKNNLPFETEQDVLRWCINQGLEKLVRLVADKDVTSEYSALSNWLRAAAKQQENLTYSKDLQKIFSVVEELEKGGHIVKAVELADLVWRQCDRFEDPYWSKLYREKSKRYLDRLKRRVGASRNGNESG